MSAWRSGFVASALASIALAMLAACSIDEKTMRSEVNMGTSDSALGRTPGYTWADATGNADRRAFDAAWRKCEEDIKQSSTDQIQRVPGNLVLDCLKSRGWRQVPVK
jgi:hypothetical protein